MVTILVLLLAQARRWTRPRVLPHSGPRRVSALALRESVFGPCRRGAADALAETKRHFPPEVDLPPPLFHLDALRKGPPWSPELPRLDRPAAMVLAAVLACFHPDWAFFFFFASYLAFCACNTLGTNRANAVLAICYSLVKPSLFHIEENRFGTQIYT